MSWEKVDRACAGCRPVLFDPSTGRILPEVDPLMVCVLAEWEHAPEEELEAFHKVTCQNSEDPGDHARVQALWSRVRGRFEARQRPDPHYCYISLRMVSANEAARKQTFERILTQCVDRILGPAWRVAPTDWDDDGPVWAVTLPGTAKPEDARPKDRPSMCANGEDIGFPVALQHKRVAFRHSLNLFCGWAQGVVAEELADYYGRGIFFDSTGRTQRPNTKEYRRGNTSHATSRSPSRRKIPSGSRNTRGTPPRATGEAWAPPGRSLS